MSATLGEMSPETLAQIVGPLTQVRSALHPERTPLHIDFSGWGDSPATPLPRSEFDKTAFDDPELFNAIGSLARPTLTVSAKPSHLPVIDVDGGADISRGGSKAILRTGQGSGRYDQRSQLRDVLGDNGIDLEVFETIRASLSTGGVSRYVGAIVLRSRSERDEFVSFPSTTDRHSHLYIQREFSEEDHKVLIASLAETGIVSSRWHEIVQREKMGILRTPWTMKQLGHRSS